MAENQKCPFGWSEAHHVCGPGSCLYFPNTLWLCVALCWSSTRKARLLEASAESGEPINLTECCICIINISFLCLLK